MKVSMRNFLINLRNIGTSAQLLKKIEELEAKNRELSDSNVELARKDIKLVMEKAVLSQSNEEMSKKAKETEKLFSLIAHDLRNPFHAFMGFTEILSSQYDDLSPAKHKEYLNLMHRQADNVFLLLTNLLNWSKMQLGHRAITLINLNLREAADNIINLLQANAYEKRISLVNEVAAGTNISADADIVEIIIRNLVSNAIKFTDSGGTITVSAAVADNLVQVSVNDTGIGIQPESLKKLFSPEFYSTLGTKNEHGTGLGLLFCREMIEQQGGTIFAESTVGQGTTMTFTVKAAE